MFRGINAITIDSKGRLTIPTRYRDALGLRLVVTIDMESCLLLYPEAEWSPVEKNLQRMSSFNPITRRYQRLYIGHATDIELDSNWRFVLPPSLREYAQLNKNVVMIGQGNKFEVWDELLWQSKREQWLALETAQVDSLPDEMKTFSL